MKSSFLAGLFAVGAAAQSPAWGQCGGKDWKGATTCVSGYTCTYSNDWYSQCIPGSAGPSTTLRTTTTAKPSTTTSSGPTGTSTPGKLKWVGINQSSAEFGQGTYPGIWGKTFTFPSTSSIQTLINDGYNAFRVCFSMERLVPNQLTGSFDDGYLRNLTQVIDYITNAGATAVIDPHNYGRYYDNIITDTNAFKTFWTNLAGKFVSNSRVVFDTNNEYNTMDQTLVLNLNQAAINGIRAAGATQYIFVEGNAWTGAWSWNTTNTNMVALTDPQNKIVYEMHQYLDSDSSGTSATCVSAQIGVQRVIGATNWLRANGKVGIIGEFAGGANSVCQQAVKGLLDHLKENSDVWQGAIWWAGGPWWADYIYSFEPPSGTGYSYYNSLLKQYTV
ncbi:glycoside hydrolase superfamily [Chaetomium sp. MPI-SDFR-AT-0129]|nr:glycoside hydrolase superfamily [Chaetomium sp. MPI-SDFR-AT-0129]